MTESTLPSYAELSKALSETTSKMHASQAQGFMCGVLCGHVEHNAWMSLVTGDEKPAKNETLQATYDVTAKQLKDFSFELAMILPGENAALPERAEALTLWCQGLLTGLKLAGIPIVDREPSEITEAIDDIIEIAKMDYDEVVPSEEDEEAYTELVEFVRMAVILIYQDAHEGDAPKRKKETASNRLH